MPATSTSDFAIAASRSSRASGTPPCCAPHALQRRQQELEGERVADVHHVRAHGAGFERVLAHAVEILALAEIERQRHHFVAFDLDEVPHRRRFDRPAGEGERHARLVSH